MVKARDCGIVVREFVLQSRYYVHFRANTLGKGMNPLPSQLWVKEYHYCFSRIALALNNLKRVDMPLNKETKPSEIVKTINCWNLSLSLSFSLCVCVCVYHIHAHLPIDDLVIDVLVRFLRRILVTIHFIITLLIIILFYYLTHIRTQINHYT